MAGQQVTFVFFIYGDIQWGDGANIGFSAGDGSRSFMVQGALTNQTLNIDEESNVGVRGAESHGFKSQQDPEIFQTCKFFTLSSSFVISVRCIYKLEYASMCQKLCSIKEIKLCVKR